MDDTGLLIRPAEPDDAPSLARLIVMAGGGVYEFLLHGLAPGMAIEDMLVPGLAGRTGSFSHRHVTVAEVAGHIVGLAHAYPVDWMKMQDFAGLPPDRIEHMADFHVTQDWGSYFLSALAVEPTHRRRGIARRLLARVYDRAREGGFDRLSMHVWADNGAARALYAAEGFTERGRARVDRHERLPHDGGSVLLERAV